MCRALLSVFFERTSVLPWFTNFPVSSDGASASCSSLAFCLGPYRFNFCSTYLSSCCHPYSSSCRTSPVSTVPGPAFTILGSVSFLQRKKMKYQHGELRAYRIRLPQAWAMRWRALSSSKLGLSWSWATPYEEVLRIYFNTSLKIFVFFQNFLTFSPNFRKLFLKFSSFHNSKFIQFASSKFSLNFLDYSNSNFCEYFIHNFYLKCFQFFFKLRTFSIFPQYFDTFCEDRLEFFQYFTQNLDEFCLKHLWILYNIF